MTPDCRLCNQRFTAALSVSVAPPTGTSTQEAFWCEKPSCFRYAALSLGLAASLDRQTNPTTQDKSVDMKARGLGGDADCIMGKKKTDLKQNKKQSHKVHYCYKSDFFFFYNASAKSSTVGSKFVMFEGEKKQDKKMLLLSQCLCEFLVKTVVMSGPEKQLGLSRPADNRRQREV